MLDEQLDHLLVYMRNNDLDKNENAMHPLFFNAQGRKLTRAGVSHILHEYVAKARMINPKLFPEKIGCHKRTHTFLTNHPANRSTFLASHNTNRSSSESTMMTGTRYIISNSSNIYSNLCETISQTRLFSTINILKISEI